MKHLRFSPVRPSLYAALVLGVLITVGFQNCAPSNVMFAGSEVPVASIAGATIQLTPPASAPAAAPAAGPRAGHAMHVAVALASGKVLIAGGMSFSHFDWTTQAFDPVAGTWASAGTLSAGRLDHAMIALADGGVLLAGGRTEGFGLNSPATETEVYDPLSNSWRQTGRILRSQYMGNGLSALARLPNDEIIMLSMFQDAGTASMPNVWSVHSLIYNPLAGAWREAAIPPAYHCGGESVVLPNANILVAGDRCGWGTAGPPKTAQVYDVLRAAWTQTGPTSVGHAQARLVGLSNGKALIVGGADPDASGSATAVAEIYDPASDAWTPTGPLLQARYSHTATVLRDGRILVAGGSWGSTVTPQTSVLRSTEIYDPSAGSWTSGPPMSLARHSHTATMLPDGRVLIAGGIVLDGYPTSAAEIYDPAANVWTSTGSMR